VESTAEDPAPRPTPEKSKYESRQISDGWKSMRSWTPVEEEGGWRMSGNCPGCGHRMSKFFRDEGLALGMAQARVEGAQGAEPVETDVVICNCTAPHEGRRESEQGCGAYWGVAATWPGAAS